MSTDQPQATPRPRVQGSARSRRISKIVVPIAVLGLVAFSIMNVWITVSREGLPTEIEGLKLYPDVRYEVVSGPYEYEVRPPYGGPNPGVVQDCGRYRVPVHDDHAVASLAVGAVWIAYDPALPEDEIDNIHAYAAPELYVISAPYPGLRAPIVLTAWGAQLEVESSRDVRIAAFIRDFAESQDVPNPNRPCSGGVNIEAR